MATTAPELELPDNDNDELQMFVTEDDFILNANDRCDGCGSQAYYKVLLKGNDTELHFCFHHYQKAEEKLRPNAAMIFDESAKLRTN